MAEIKVKEIKTLNYARPAIQKGYANQTLYVDLSDSKISIKPVSEKMKEIFVGGKGFDLWLLFDKGYDGCWIGCTLACSHGVKDFVPSTGSPYSVPGSASAASASFPGMTSCRRTTSSLKILPR